MEVYTPTTTAFAATAELPEDLIDLRTAASVRTGIEAALNNAAYLQARHIAAYGNSYGTGGVAMHTQTDDATEEIIKYDGVHNLNCTLTNCVASDLVIVLATFTAATAGCNATYRLMIGEPGATPYATEIQQATIIDGSAGSVALHGFHVVGYGTMSAPIELVAYITVENSDGSGFSNVYGQVNVSFVKVRMV
jgi:hypothetical protein